LRAAPPDDAVMLLHERAADAARLAETAVREHQTHLVYLAEILSAEIGDRTGRRRTRRTAEARFPRIKRLADYNPDHIPGIAATLAALAGGAWIDAGEPVVLLGDSGTGRAGGVEVAVGADPLRAGAVLCGIARQVPGTWR
jgi:DNA replication protein DnaC